MRWSFPIFNIATKTSAVLLVFALLSLAIALFGYSRFDHAFWSILSGFLVWNSLYALHCWYGLKISMADAREREWQAKRIQSKADRSRRSLLEQANADEISPNQFITRERYPTFFRIGQWILWFPALVAFGWSLYYGFTQETSFSGWLEADVRLFATLLLLAGVSQSLAARYCISLELGESRRWLSGLLSLAQLTGWLMLISGGILFLYLMTGWDLGNGWIRGLAWVFLILLIDALSGTLKPLFQPPSNRSEQPLLGGSFILNLAFQRLKATRDLMAGLEKILGGPLNELWLWRSLKIYTPPFLIAIFILLWLTSMFTVVPMGYRGIKVELGEYKREALDPGLHFTLPWPWGRVEIVPTQRVQVISIGQATDLGTPILWNEKHFEDEVNLLINDGEELLTINIPVYYQITDPFLYLTGGQDFASGIPLLASQYLLLNTVNKESYEVMTQDRLEVATTIREQLQARLDEWNAGIKILQVAPKDIHPPIEVAESYQDVVSAEEDLRTEMEMALAYRAEMIPGAAREAFRLRREANASSQARVINAEGDTLAFSLLRPEFESHPRIFRHQRYFAALERGLEGPEKLIFPKPVSGNYRTNLDFRSSPESR